MASPIKNTLRRMRYGEPVIVISGLPRSGTSMTMKMLDAAGIEVVVDGIRTADEDNPKGYFEDERVKDLAKADDKSFLRNARGKVIKIISYLLKELPETNQYKVIFMNRKLEEVLASQKKMLDRRGEESDTSDEKMIEIYKDHLWKVSYLMKHKSCFDRLSIDYARVIEAPLEEAGRIAAFLGMDLDTQKMAAVVDKNLYRNRR